MDKMIFKTGDRPEFLISSDLNDFPVGGCPAYLTESLVAVCVSGSASLQVFNTVCRVVPEVIVVLLPWQLASLTAVSEDFRITFFRVSKDMFTDSLSSLWRLTPEFFFYMRKHFVSTADEGNTQRFLSYCNLLSYRVKYAPENCRRESIMQLLRVLYWDLYAYYDSDPLAMKAAKYTRKEELAFRFMRMIIEDHAADKDVAYYAEKLDVSPKYLTSLIRSVSGQSARDWIVYYAILEIKSLLRESSMDLKAIVARVNFPDQSSLSRFFRHYTGMSPSQYRKTIRF